MLSIELDELKKAHHITDEELERGLDEERVYLSQLTSDNLQTSFQVQYVAALKEYTRLECVQMFLDAISR